MIPLAEKFPGTWRKSLTGYSYYLPASLEHAQRLTLPLSLSKQIQSASLALGEFSSLIERIPNPQLFIHAYAKKEALLSSRIEGTQATIEDAFRQQDEVAIEKRDDWAEVNAYIDAMKFALNTLHELPLCNRLIKSTHRQLLSQVRGKHKQPGEFRGSQNWIGGSRPDNAHFVPPAHEYIVALMNDLEKFIMNKQLQTPELINAALLHYQFETIHPFLDGNGRMGRMLVALYLMEKKILKHPILYISTFLEQNRKDYYASLDQARESEKGVVQWLSFFLDAVEQTAKNGINVTQKLIDYDTKLRNQQIPQFGRQAKNALKMLDLMYKMPVINAKKLQENLNFSPQVSHNMLRLFINHQILKEVTGNKRNRQFVFLHYLDLLMGH